MKRAFETAASYRRLIEAQRILTVMLASNAPRETIDYQERSVEALRAAWTAEDKQPRRAAGGTKGRDTDSPDSAAASQVR